MSEYTLATLNSFEYAGIYLKKKQSAEYARIPNVSDAIHSLRSLYKLLSIYKFEKNYFLVFHFYILLKSNINQLCPLVFLY